MTCKHHIYDFEQIDEDTIQATCLKCGFDFIDEVSLSEMRGEIDE